MRKYISHIFIFFLTIQTNRPEGHGQGHHLARYKVGSQPPLAKCGTANENDAMVQES